MECKINIRKNETGEIRSVNYTGTGRKQIDYLWTDGDNGCDCNRELYFERAGGNDPETECSEGRFSIQLIETKTNEMFYDEF